MRRQYTHEWCTENTGLFEMTFGVLKTCYTVHLRKEYVVAPMDQEILIVLFYDVLCAVLMHFSPWSASSLRWRGMAVRRPFVRLHFMNVGQL